MIHADFNACNTTSWRGSLPSRRAPGNEVGISVVQNEVTNESDARVCSIHSLCLIISAVDVVILKTGLISHLSVLEIDACKSRDQTREKKIVQQEEKFGETKEKSWQATWPRPLGFLAPISSTMTPRAEIYLNVCSNKLFVMHTI